MFQRSVHHICTDFPLQISLAAEKNGWKWRYIPITQHFSQIKYNKPCAQTIASRLVFLLLHKNTTNIKEKSVKIPITHINKLFRKWTTVITFGSWKNSLNIDPIFNSINWLLFSATWTVFQLHSIETIYETEH